MNSKELEAYTCLANGASLVNPRFSSKPEQVEAALKEQCRKCWQYREHFPYWVKALVEKWAAEKRSG